MYRTRTKRRMARTAMVAIAGALVLATVAPGVAQAGIVPRHGILFGSHVSPRWGLYQGPTVRAYEKRIGRQFDIVNRYHAFSDHDYTTEASMASEGRIPMISWRAIDSNSTPDPNAAAKIARGDFDAKIRAAATAVKHLGTVTLIRFAWEMTQAPGQLQYIGTPKEFIAAWRHVVTIFRNQGAHNARFVWAPQAASFCNHHAQPYYPGDAWVNWVDASAVPIDNFESFGGLFHCYYGWAKNRPHPMMVWTGVVEKPGNPIWKARYLRRARRKIHLHMPKLKAFMYFNSINGKTDYWADTTARSFKAYVAMACAPYFETGGPRATC
jgi:hypothetical protein